VRFLSLKNLVLQETLNNRFLLKHAGKKLAWKTFVNTDVGEFWSIARFLQLLLGLLFYILNANFPFP